MVQTEVSYLVVHGGYRIEIPIPSDFKIISSYAALLTFKKKFYYPML